MGLFKYWEENPNHKIEWGESGGLPIDPRTIHIVVEDGAFVSTDATIVRLGGTNANMTINATERQKQRGLNQPFDYGTVITEPGGVRVAQWDEDSWDSSLWS